MSYPKNSWKNIPQTQPSNTYSGLMIDAQIDRELQIIFYDETKMQLFTFSQPIDNFMEFYGDLSQEFPNLKVEVQKQMNLLTDEIIETSFIPYNQAIKLIKKSKYKKLRKHNKLPQQLHYLHRLGIVPGSRIRIENDELAPLILENNDKQKMMEEVLLGDHPAIIELCTQNMLIFEDEIPIIPSIAFDIEVSSPRGNFPIPEDAKYQIHSIALFDSNGKAYSLILGMYPTSREIQEIERILGYKVEIKNFISEKALLRYFIDILLQYQFIVSFNGDGFDLPYLYYRCKKMGIESHITLSSYFYFRPDLQFDHAVHIDLYRFFANDAVRLYAYGGKYSRTRLTDVSAALLESEKIGHDKWFDEMNRIEMVSYNVHDAKLTSDLLTHSNNLTWKLMVILMRVGRITLSYVNRATISSWVFNWIVAEHITKNLYVPSRKELIARGTFESNSIIDGRQYKGAIVFPAESGIYWNISVVDYNSLYPSTIKNFNISYETVRCKHSGCKINLVPELEHWVCTRRLGIMATLVGYVREIRVRYYKKLSKDKNPQVKELATTIQAALKVFINAGYGVFGSPKFQLYCPPIAESTTAFSRHMLMSAKAKAEEMGLEILYGDTDSIFIQNISEEQLKILRSWSIIEAGIELNVDYVFRFLVMSGRKKNYFGVTTDNKLIIKGLSIKKSNTASFIRNTFEDIGLIFRKVKTKEELDLAQQLMIDKIKSELRKLKNGFISIDELSHQVSLNKNFDEISSKTPAVQVALQKQLEDTSVIISKGEQYRVVRVKSFTFVNNSNLFPYIKTGDPVTCSYRAIEDSTGFDIDFQYYIDAIRRAFIPIFDAFDMDYDEALNENTKLTDFFEEVLI